MTTDSKKLENQKVKYPGIAKLVSRLVWDQETVRSSRTTRTKSPLKSRFQRAFSLFIAAQILINKHNLTFLPTRVYIHLRGFPDNKKRHGRLVYCEYTSPALR